MWHTLQQMISGKLNTPRLLHNDICTKPQTLTLKHVFLALCSQASVAKLLMWFKPCKCDQMYIMWSTSDSVRPSQLLDFKQKLNCQVWGVHLLELEDLLSVLLSHVSFSKLVDTLRRSCVHSIIMLQNLRQMI